MTDPRSILENIDPLPGIASPVLSTDEPLPAEPWLFSEICPRCAAIVNAAFCTDDSCRRRFVVSPRRTRLVCPIHDPEVPREVVKDTMRLAVQCASCTQNLYGIKPGDGERWDAT